MKAKAACRRLIRAAVPLSIRKRAALALQRHTWIDQQRRHWWAVELVRDLADRDLDAFHQFLWTHHLGYAESYEATGRFGPDGIKLSRRMFFSDLCNQLAQLGVPDEWEIRSVFEVGCSLGYQLRFMETDLFPAATTLAGIDIDRYAIQSGSEYLSEVGSKVELQCADTRDIERIVGGTTYDLIICTGVLMYLNEQAATEAVAAMLRHARLVAMAGLAHPTFDNARLDQADMRTTDRTFIHNFDAMVKHAGGRVVGRRWEGGHDVDGNTIYFVFATK